MKSYTRVQPDYIDRITANQFIFNPDQFDVNIYRWAMFCIQERWYVENLFFRFRCL